MLKKFCIYNNHQLFRGAGSAIVVYDITSQYSFVRAKSWIAELHKQANPNIIIALAGNKSDLESLRSVKYEDASNYAKENNLIFFETSAKNDHNVFEIFKSIAKEIPKALIFDKSSEFSESDASTTQYDI